MNYTSEDILLNYINPKLLERKVSRLVSQCKINFKTAKYDDKIMYLHSVKGSSSDQHSKLRD